MSADDVTKLLDLHEASREGADREDFSCTRCNHTMCFDGQDTRGFCNDCAQELLDESVAALRASRTREAALRLALEHLVHSCNFADNHFLIVEARAALEMKP